MILMPKQNQVLQEFFPRDADNQPTHTRQLLGVVVSGSLSKGLQVKLEADHAVEDLAVGRYVVVRGQQHKRFFCMITDIQLHVTNAALAAQPPNMANPFMRAVYSGTSAYATLQIAPMLMIDTDEKPRPVKTIPSHFTLVETATEKDVNDVFGPEDEDHFNVGSPLELEQTQINLDLQRLVERSVGVFGKSGTGKSFLTRILLAGTIQRGKAVNLIFDMHNDYGWEVSDERGPKAKGLKQLFPSKVSILTLDEESSRRRQAKYDAVVTIGYDEIEPQDIEMLKDTLDLSDAMIDAAYILHKKYGKKWISHFLEMESEELDEFIASHPVGASSVTALHRRLSRFERWEFLKKDGSSGNSVREIINLISQQKSVVLEFGRYGNNIAAYILVANYLTRRIHQHYVEAVEKALGDAALEPPQLMITIEEAHKFLDPAIARQTIFGIIARELRKYNVTLLVVDQRPSGIDEEVMSQIGTRVTALLDNERDINAVLTGISGAHSLREVLARLDTKQQAIIMGHAVPMPVVVKTRAYDTEFYRAIGYIDDEHLSTHANRARQQLGDDQGRRRL